VLCSNRQSKLIRADFYKTDPAKPDFEKDLHKSVKQQNKLSSGARTALGWPFRGRRGNGRVLATNLGGNNRNISPCGGGITAELTWGETEFTQLRFKKTTR